jgi:hypothetical protein
MPNPFDPTYLTTPALFGPVEWAFFLLQIAGVAGGIYLAYMRQDSNELRKKLLKQLGFALIAVGAVGVLLSFLRLNLVGIFGQPFWFLLLFAAELGLAIYVVYYARMVYPSQLAQSRTKRGRASARQSTARAPAGQSRSPNGESGEAHTETVGHRGGRREARHRRKRKSRS